MKIPYDTILSYRYKIPSLYQLPVFRDEYAMVLSEIAPTMNILDFGCGNGKIYNDVLLPEGFSGEYVGLDIDESLDVNFPLFHNIEDLLEEYGARHFDVLFMLNVIEHLTVEEFFNQMEQINKLIDGKIIIMTPNPKCFDYMFGDPEHVTFYPHYWLYGIAKVFDFDNVKIWRGKGIAQDREREVKQRPEIADQVKAMNEFQRKVCQSMGLDWYGNLLLIGERENE